MWIFNYSMETILKNSYVTKILGTVNNPEETGKFQMLPRELLSSFKEKSKYTTQNPMRSLFGPSLLLHEWSHLLCRISHEPPLVISPQSSLQQICKKDPKDFWYSDSQQPEKSYGERISQCHEKRGRQLCKRNTM